MAEDLDVESMPGLTDTDRENLAGGDEKFSPHTWEELKQIIGSIDPSHCFRLSPYPPTMQL
jgi:hypothetical protein